MQAWDDFLALQERELGRETVRKWLKPLQVRHFDACNLYLEARDSFQVMWFEEHVRAQVQTKLLNRNNRRIKVHLTVSHGDEPQEVAIQVVAKPATQEVRPFGLSFDPLDEKRTFEGFVPFSGNELACKLMNGLGTTVELGSFNPVFIHGQEGAGKSHLLMGATLALRAQGKRVIYARAQTFTEHVVSAIRAGEMQLFRSYYRNVDVLLIDDVQVLSRKSATQEELFHTFNTLHVAGKQLIIAADCAPGELRGIEPRLVSRFEWGIVMPLALPEPADLRQIILKRAASLEVKLSPDAVTYLVDTFASGPPAAMRALEALVLRSHLQGDQGELSLAKTKSYLADLVEEEKRSEVTPYKIIAAVATHYGIQSEDILGKSQKKESSLPRQVAMHLCRTELRLPFAQIGDVFGRDHSTVMTSVKRIEEQVAANEQDLAAVVYAIRKAL